MQEHKRARVTLPSVSVSTFEYADMVRWGSESLIDISTIVIAKVKT